MTTPELTFDPALDANADGNFGSSGVSHRAGYSNDPLANAEYWARKGGTLNAGEGALLCAEIDRLREQLRLANIDAANELAENAGLREQLATADAEREQAYQVAQQNEATARRLQETYNQFVTAALDAVEKLSRTERILAALREPSLAVVKEVQTWMPLPRYEAKNSEIAHAIRVAVKAAEREVSA